MVPLSHLHIGGTEIRGDQILPDCIGDRARVSKEQAWMSQCVFCMEKVHYLEKKLHFFSLNACPLEEKSSFLSFLGATKTKPYSLVLPFFVW